MHENQPPWWRGKRGEWYVIVQLVLIGVFFFGPRTLPGLPDWPALRDWISTFAGAILIFAGAALFFAGLLMLGSGLTPLPYPRAKAKLIQTGPYGIVRHPIYAGGLVLAYGWALAVQGWFTLLYATILLVFLDFKSAREERWLVEKFPDYPEYQRRVRRLIPFVY
ncbi:MAG: isoprenylcysteine carboxylmethyltransferase family protein [Acidobacteria bacterium]|nr:MAG: isoprenylcysteine carboxylmethyltransferase family protein [Acidobacteriota bacterium]